MAQNEQYKLQMGRGIIYINLTTIRNIADDFVINKTIIVNQCDIYGNNLFFL